MTALPPVFIGSFHFNVMEELRNVETVAGCVGGSGIVAATMTNVSEYSDQPCTLCERYLKFRYEPLVTLTFEITAGEMSKGVLET